MNTNPGFQPFGYCGGLTDRNTNLIKFGARDYSPAIGRWLSKEPLGFSAGQNFYIYTYNNSINLIDVNGLYSIDVNTETFRIHAEITERGETLWGLAERLTGDGRNWKNIISVDPCEEIIPTNIQVGDMFDVTGLFDQETLNTIFHPYRWKYPGYQGEIYDYLRKAHGSGGKSSSTDGLKDGSDAAWWSYWLYYRNAGDVDSMHYKYNRRNP